MVVVVFALLIGVATRREDGALDDERRTAAVRVRKDIVLLRSMTAEESKMIWLLREKMARER